MICDICGEDTLWSNEEVIIERVGLFKRSEIYKHRECLINLIKEQEKQERRLEILDEINRASRQNKKITEKKINIRDLDNNFFLPCNLCGTTTCQNKNSCMTTSD